MSVRSPVALTALLAVTSLADSSRLSAQATFQTRSHPDPNLVAAPAIHVLHCGPAPLTERPGIQWEFSRPRLAVLETAFAQAARDKRSVGTLRSGK